MMRVEEFMKIGIFGTIHNYIIDIIEAILKIS